ncbi:MAG: flippase [Anaerolineae bacterium]|nr:flippase [Anaerolineae bacterium]
MLVKHISTTLVTQLFTVIANILTSMVISRALQPEGKGILAAYLTTVNFIVLFGTVGLPKAYTYEVGRVKGQQETISTSFAVAVINAVLVALLTVQLARIEVGGVFDQFDATILNLAVPTTIVTLLFGAFNAILRGMNRITECNVGLLIFQSLYLVLNVGIAWLFDLTLDRVIIVYVTSYLVAILYYYIVIRRTSPGRAFSFAAVRGLFRYGLKYQAYSAINMLHNRVDILILGVLLTDAQVGFYSTAVTIAQMLWNLPLAITFVLLPYVASHQDEQDISQRTAQVTRASTLLLIVASVGLAFVSPLLIEIVYGESFVPAVSPLRVLLPGAIAYSIVYVAAADLLGRDKLVSLTLVSGCVLVVNVGLNFLLIPNLGVEGAALTSTLTYSLNAIAVAWLIKRNSRITMRDVLVPRWSDVTLMFGAFRRTLAALPEKLSRRSSS